MATTAPRPPCPKCGASGIAVELQAAEELTIVEELTIALEPADQSRDWKRRWEEVQRELERVRSPHAEQLSGDAIHAARQQLHSFYIQTYHLKDALKLEGPALGVSPQAVEDAITNDPDLSLLADLANLDKHGKLTRPPRSGDAPTDSVRGVQAGSGEGGWRLEVTVAHHGKALDGLRVARAAIDAWRRHLIAWGLLST
jgi:hypothetical protein